MKYEKNETLDDRDRPKTRNRQQKWKNGVRLENSIKMEKVNERRSNENSVNADQSKNYQDKRSRSSNWDDAEKHFLIECVKDHLALLESTRPDTDTCEKKKVIWNQIEQQFHRNGFNRDAVRIKEQWRRLKSNAKKTYMTYKRNIERNRNCKKMENPNKFDRIIRKLFLHENWLDTDNDNMSDSDSGVCQKKMPVKFEKSFNSESRNGWSLLALEDRNLPDVSEKKFKNISVSNKLSQNIIPMDDIKIELDEDNEEFEEIAENNGNVTEDELFLENLAVNEPHNILDNPMDEPITNNISIKESLPLSIKLPQMQRIVQEPSSVHRPVPMLINYNGKNSLNTLVGIDANDLTTNDETDLIKLKRKLLMADLERIEKQKKFDVELHQQKMKYEIQIAQKRMAHLDYMHRLKVALEKRYYKRRLECLALNTS